MRYLPHHKADRDEMRRAIGISSVDELFSAVQPSDLLNPKLDLPEHQSEIAVTRYIKTLAAKNTSPDSVACFIGAGAYRHHVPASVDHLIQRSEFLTTYTPYQPEIAQGSLQSLFEFQTQVAGILGCEVANASMYDGSTAVAEAALMALRITKRKRILVSGTVHPQYRDTVKTEVENSGAGVRLLPLDITGEERLVDKISEDYAAVILQNPAFSGSVYDISPIVEAARAAGVLVIAGFSDVTAFGMIDPPGAKGADIVAGEGQSIGNSLTFGGPYVGLFAVRQKYVRQMPGRLCGQAVDAEGRRCFTLVLAAREQHIRRENATSNICTNAGLCALAFTIHMSLLGSAGLRKMAEASHYQAVKLARALASIDGVSLLTRSFYNEFVIEVEGIRGDELIEELAHRGVFGGVPLSRLEPGRPDLANKIVVAATELNSSSDRARYVTALREVLS